MGFWLLGFSYFVEHGREPRNLLPSHSHSLLRYAKQGCDSPHPGRLLNCSILQHAHAKEAALASLFFLFTAARSNLSGSLAWYFIGNFEKGEACVFYENDVLHPRSLRQKSSSSRLKCLGSAYYVP